MFLVDDYTRLSAPRLLIGTAAAALLVFLGIEFLDYPLSDLLRNLDGRFWGVFTMFGAANFWLLLAFFTFLFKLWSTGISSKNAGSAARFIINGRSAYLTASAVVLCCVASATIISETLKVLIGRLRPAFYESMNWKGFNNFSFDDAWGSMPSTHASATFAALVAIGLMFPATKKFMWAFACLLGLSRIIVGAHFPSDVLFGAFIGLLVADVVYVSFKRAALEGEGR
ncbi:MAG: phosphatase PAP2 family protein [Rickettsiales bacterium]|jgi:undecaprenyl-diphosphatase|nr:phosphatase PAP2 family protein [Rickettsiales bacterium]